MKGIEGYKAKKRPHSSSKWCQSRPFRASREASRRSTAPSSTSLQRRVRQWFELDCLVVNTVIYQLVSLVKSISPIIRAKPSFLPVRLEVIVWKAASGAGFRGAAIQIGSIENTRVSGP